MCRRLNDIFGTWMKSVYVSLINGTYFNESSGRDVGIDNLVHFLRRRLDKWFGENFDETNVTILCSVGKIFNFRVQQHFAHCGIKISKTCLHFKHIMLLHINFRLCMCFINFVSVRWCFICVKIVFRRRTRWFSVILRFEAMIKFVMQTVRVNVQEVYIAYRWWIS